MLEWVNSHGLLSIAIYYAVASAIGAMPTPVASSSGLYQWAYKFLNGLMQLVAANATRLPMVRNVLGLTSTSEDKK